MSSFTPWPWSSLFSEILFSVREVPCSSGAFGTEKHMISDAAIARKSRSRSRCPPFMHGSETHAHSSHLVFSVRHVCSVETGRAATADPVRSCSRRRARSLFQHCVSLWPTATCAQHPVSPFSLYSVVYPLDVYVFGEVAASSRDEAKFLFAYPAPRLAFRQKRGRKVRSRRRGCSACSFQL